jgi:hypothetical protein
MDLLLFCITIVSITFASLEAARMKRDENLQFEVCPESHNFGFDQGKVEML